MILDSADLTFGSTITTRLAVVGAGPAGIVAALEAARRGVDVVLVESGGRKQDHRIQQLSAAQLVDAEVHAPAELAVGRQVGGTSSIWGGRCVPYDPIDFEDRPIAPHSSWPVRYDDLEPYFARSSAWLACGHPVFSAHETDALSGNMIDGLSDGAVLTSSLERWSLPTNFGTEYGDRLNESPHVRLITSATCVEIETDAATRCVTRIRCRSLTGVTFWVAADDFILAAGGLESTRLLLSTKDLTTGKSLGDHSGHLGRWYMAHLEGVIADLELDPSGRPVVYDYERDVDGVYVRRRFTFPAEVQQALGLPNIAGWIANPELSDAAHGDPALSFTYLALISPVGHLFAPESQRLSLTGTRMPGAPYGTAHRSPVGAHLANLVRHPLATLVFVFGFGARRTFSRRRKPPGFFVHRPKGAYPFQYHAEHLPHRESRVCLSDDCDELGLPRLLIDIRFTDEDLRGVLAAHELWDAYLREHGVGRLRYHEGDLKELVRARCGGGFHQVGSTRMSRDPVDGVVDEDLCVHGVSNLHVASSSVFVTSGQANSTFMVVAFTLRLIDHLYGI